MYIDTHCHLEKSDYDDIDLVIKENREAGVSKIIVSGYSRKSIKEALKYACQYSDVYLTIGYHPSEVLDVFDSDIDELEKITNTKFEEIYILGGGAKNSYLNDLTAYYTKRKVKAFPIEATSFGNLKIQMEFKKWEKM